VQLVFCRLAGLLAPWRRFRASLVVPTGSEFLLLDRGAAGGAWSSSAAASAIWIGWPAGHSRGVLLSGIFDNALRLNCGRDAGVPITFGKRPASRGLSESGVVLRPPCPNALFAVLTITGHHRGLP